MDTSPVPTWPDWLEDARLEDAALAAAYEATDAPLRGCVKTALALLAAVYGERPHCAEQYIRDLSSGFSRRVRRTPAPWTLLIMTPDYVAAPRLAASLMPALLAHVPLVGALCPGGPPSPAARVALELAGLEDIFLPEDTETIARLLRHLRQQGTGRLLLLHAGELDALRRAADALDIPCWEEAHPPRLTVLPRSGHNEAFLEWGHPDATFQREATAADAVFCAAGQENRALSLAPLVLLPGMEGCWLHPRLTPDFFLQTATVLSMTAPPTFSGEQP